MSDTPTPKIRFKLPGGEEFEAEGSVEFIEAQRDYFLQLIGHDSKPQQGESGTNVREDQLVTGMLSPGTSPTAFQTSPITNLADSTAGTPSSHLFSSHTRLWEQLLEQEGDSVFLRRKLHLPAQEAALILLAGGKEVLHKNRCTALWLSRALGKSGFTTGRLDRLLAPCIQLGWLQSQGSKRSRLYTLTESGLARAFVLAEKKAIAS